MTVANDMDGDDFFAATDATDAARNDDAPDRTRRAVPPRLGMLAQLTDPEFDAVARSAQLAHVAAGTNVFRQGDEADRFHVVVEGGVEVLRDGVSIATLGPGTFFGESAFLVHGRRSATVRTLVDSSIWSIDYAAFGPALSRHLFTDDAMRAEAERRIAGTPRDAFD